MSTPYLLQCAIKEVLTPELSTFPLAIKSQAQDATSVAQIFIADVPPRTKSTPEHVPYICIQEQSGKDTEEGFTEVEIILRCAVYSNHVEEAAQELSNLVQLTRHTLLPFVTAPLKKRYRLVLDSKQRLLPWERPLEQMHPYAEAFILTVWNFKGFEHHKGDIS